jgi:hypothetical protein
MSYYYTKVPIDISPAALYTLTDDIYLKPASRKALKNYPARGATMFFDYVFFISRSDTQEEHITKLRDWVLFHSFMFDFGHLCYFFENGFLSSHKAASSIGRIFLRKWNP